MTLPDKIKAEADTFYHLAWVGAGGPMRADYGIQLQNAKYSCDAVKQQAKLVRCISGKVYDVIIDLRKDSPTFMKWQGFYLTGENQYELYVPEGFGHGYLVLEDSIVSYKCNENFFAEGDGGIK